MNGKMIGLLAVVSAVWMGGCTKTQTPAEPTPAASSAETAQDPMEISVTEEIRKWIQVGQPPKRAVRGTLRVAGRVEADETRLARVSAPVTGRIVTLDAIEGQQVKRGDVLATLYSTDLAAAESEYLKAVSQQEVMQRAVVRAQQLLDAGVIGVAELQRRESELQQVAADVASAREQLGVLGLASIEIERVRQTRAVNSTTRIVATIDGIVLERRATMGQVVQAVETVFVIADLSQVWLVADVPEQSAGNLQVGKTVQAEIPALPDDHIVGEISFVSAIVNPETRTVRTRMNLGNPHRRYKPAMLTTMTLVDAAEPRLVVPATAVVRDEDTDYVFVQIAPDSYRLRAVTLGEDSGNFRVVTSGLEGTETIITDGAFHLNNERKRRGSDSESE